MDSRIIEYGKEQRIALARIVSDLIMADKIIDDKEVRTFTNLFGKQHNRDLFRDAQGLTFAQAMKLLTLPEDNINDSKHIRKINAATRLRHSETAAEILTETANSDGFCAPSEAALLLCIDYYLRKNNTNYTKYDVQSFRLRDLFIGKRFVLYADFSNSSVRCIIEEHYDFIANLLASIGFQFIYIPQIVKLYKDKGVELFKNLSMYMFPDIQDEKVEEVYNNISQMTTKKFIQEYLNDKLGFNISCPKPALMVMLGRSSRLGKDLNKEGLPYETYANFLKISIEDDNVLNVISDFVANYNKHVAFNINIDFNPSKDKLMYHGIHKAFFRLVALAKKNRNYYNIDINTSINAIFVNDNKMKLTPGISSIYILILCRSLFGDKLGLPSNRIYSTLTETEKDDIQVQYETICGYLKNQERKPLAKLYPNITNRISVIKNELNEIVSEKFIDEIQLGVGDYTRTFVTADHVTINGIPIEEHNRWNKII